MPTGHCPMYSNYCYQQGAGEAGKSTFFFAFLSCTASCFSKILACKLTKIEDLIFNTGDLALILAGSMDRVGLVLAATRAAMFTET